ncbi:Hybrid signal transduction histidine kinase B [Lachnellula suecica]|uniref:Hybrid signal transduction histidine kinase B n=1 Tax=Lachnellula suecica TaxID=602035 RepID=A0A8T9C948_9HELO|nr:Hybrid signal transduction histidine kinase B [Lachnellula suecica]
MASAEIFRAREVYRYYQPRGVTESADVPSNARDQDSAGSAPHKENNFTTQQAFSDTALTAFTQLIALRLGAQRAIVSLIDHENEYMLAESTSNLSYAHDGPTQNAWLSISGARVPLDASLSEKTLRLVPNQKSTVEMTPVCFVQDLRLDENMSKLECVKGAPHLRFYCGVPLTNKKGVNIGCVYVVDPEPRSTFSLEHAQFLTTMAATVMDHLENIRAKEDVSRVTRMSQALHAFIEGDGTLEGDWQRLKRYDLPAGAGVGFSWESTKADGDAVQTSKSHIKRQSLQLPSSEATPPGMSPLQYTTNNQDARFNFNNSPWSSSSETPQIPHLKSVLDGAGDATAKLIGGRDEKFSTDGFSNLLHGTFSRASNLVREGMEVDGAVFFDAPFRFYQGRSTLQPETRRSDTTESRTDSSDDEDDDHPAVRPGPRPYAAHSFQGSVTSSVSRGSAGLKSDILGFSTKESSSWNNQDTERQSSFQPIEQSLLTSLVRHYPKGQLFVFDENGPTLPPHSSAIKDSQATIIPAITEEKRARQQERKIKELQRLLDAFPGSRQIFFVPLYDSTSGCFIGSFSWSKSKFRIYTTENHLSYLVAFGHSVMAEVSRLNTLSADASKGDFISNVSHELRSPLHGILASVEFLADTTLDGFQRNLVETVDICGRTLLDTIESVLDFSQIKKFGQDSIKPMGTVADQDISALIEEVLESSYAGFEFNGLSNLGLADTTKSHAQGPSATFSSGKLLQTGVPQLNSTNEPLSIIIDMGYRNQWKFPTVPGTWRRLTMNIFSNALKYSPSGFINVKLEARSIPPTDDTKISKSTMVTLKISDSGKGMSSDFMKTKLFQPFSQEDVTAPGTGLGMSIVKQIVDLAGGTIAVRSELGVGTEITLSLPLENNSPDIGDQSTTPSDPSNTMEDPIAALRRRSRGRTVTIRGFEPIPGTSNLQRKSLLSLKASIEKYIREWFQLEIVTDDGAADILICDESALVYSSATQLQFLACLILCSNSARRDVYTAKLDTSQAIEFVSKPCGPHRLAKALLNCFDTEDGKSLGVIGDLQSRKVGFSPTTSLNTALNISKDGERTLKAKPNDISKTSPLEANNLKRKTSPSENTSTNETSKAPSDLGSTNSSTVKNNGSREPALKKHASSRTPKMLLVEAFQKRPEGFDVIFMDVSMPVMSGFESTRLIRGIEAERRIAYEHLQRVQSPWLSPPQSSFPFHIPPSSTSTSPSSFPSIDLHLSKSALQLNKPALIIALTGFSSEKDQEMAFESGVDVFMTKPVRFREVGKILEGWAKSRERDSLESATTATLEATSKLRA